MGAQGLCDFLQSLKIESSLLDAELLKLKSKWMTQAINGQLKLARKAKDLANHQRLGPIEKRQMAMGL